jgi:MFS superfamily sulfate permease-like transporter
MNSGDHAPPEATPSQQTTNPAPLPPDGLRAFLNLETLRSDVIAGFLVFLIALPLCLGIAMASGFPAVAGLLTAIVSGLVVTPLMGSRLTIKGPAAGLIVIILAALEELGAGVDAFTAYQLTLAAIVLAGGLQVVAGLLRAGALADKFPSSAVHGMLAAIGVIIAAKQLHVLFGLDPLAKTPLGQLAELPSSALHENPEITLIGVLCLLILVLWPRLRNARLRMVPAPLLALAVAIPLGVYFDLDHEHIYLFAGVEYRLGPGLLVSQIDSIVATISAPDFSKIGQWVTLKWALVIAAVGAIESMASAKAIDSLDPFQRRSDQRRDLIAVGVGNLVAGMIGGLPMISEIVRSSANISAGARTRWANLFHGLFLLGFVALAPGLIHMIPRTALAAMLVLTGARLAHPRHFVAAYKHGVGHFVAFLTVVIVTLAEDLLLGIAAGVVIQFIADRLARRRASHQPALA